MSIREYLLEAIPEFMEIADEKLRESTIQAYETAMLRGGWESMEEIPFTLLIPNLDKNFVSHTQSVTNMAISVADTRKDLDRDLIVSGALLHDIGKLLEYEMVNGEVRACKFGKMVRHPVSGAGLAMEFGLPDDIVHIIAVHSREGDGMVRTPEAVVIHHCDFIDFEIEKSKRGMK